MGRRRTIEALAATLGQAPLRRRWIVAPSRRIGAQWIAAICDAGQPLVNVRITTLGRLALELAGPAMAERGLELLHRQIGDRLVERALRRASEASSASARRYLLGLRPSDGLSRAVGRTLADLRLAGVDARKLREGQRALEHRDKAEELATLLQAYEDELAAQGLIDHAGACRLAQRRLESSRALRGTLGRRALLVLPAHLEHELNAVERALWQALPAEQRLVVDDDDDDGAALVGGQRRFAAVGEVNEVREVLRRSLARGWPLDQLELLHTDFATYVPLIFEIATTTLTALSASLDALPLTFAEGLPVSLLRPGRALRGWLAGRDDRVTDHGARLVAAGLTDSTAQSAPVTVASGDAALVAAWTFVAEQVRARGRLDRFAQRALLAEIEQLRLDPPREAEEAWRWLAALPERLRVGGEGPRPGRLHVASVWSGGHSGRRYSFVVGLDDSRLPAGLQDPLLLDAERRRLSPRLATAAQARGRLLHTLRRTLATLDEDSELTLSFSERDLVGDRELFAALAEIGPPLPAPAGFVPADEKHSLSVSELWQRLLVEIGDGAGERLVGERHPHLRRGLEARAARASDRFTTFDGWVPEAGAALDPSRPADGRWRTSQPVLAATPLEMLGRSPFDYFCRHVLEIAPPARRREPEGRWLDGAERGALLHEIYYELMRELMRRREAADEARHRPLLERIITSQLARQRARRPPADRVSYEQDVEQVRRAATIFLVDEAQRRGEGLPFCLEAAVGARAKGDGTPLDDRRPAELRLPSGRVVRARGHIDRVDLLAGRGLRFAIWDYKTASSYGYHRLDPFVGGRRAQGALYLLLVNARLHAAVSPRATAERFGYFFPTIREHGLRVDWSAAELAGGPALLDALCELIARGCFPCAEEPEQMRFSDYRPLLGDVEQAAAATRRKLGNPGEAALEPLRRLRRVASEAARLGQDQR